MNRELVFTQKPRLRPGTSSLSNPRPQDYCPGCGRSKWQFGRLELCHVCARIARSNAISWWNQFDEIEPGISAIERRCPECDCAVSGRSDKLYCSRICLNRAFARRKGKEYFRFQQQKHRAKGPGNTNVVFGKIVWRGMRGLS